MHLSEYHERSRQLSVSLIYVLPLLVLYEVGILATGSRLENAIGLHFFKGPLLGFFGTNGFLVFNAALVMAFVVAYTQVERRGQPKTEMFVLMTVESAAYAIFFGAIVLHLLRQIPGFLSIGGLAPRQAAVAVVLSMGAGVYEEVFFRLLLLGGTLWVMERQLGCDWGWAALFAVVSSSLIFSAVHYIGPRPYPFSLTSFTIRYLAGVLLAIVYLGRGLGIAVYTHAIYDILSALRAPALA